jgi:glutathione S-transferase
MRLYISPLACSMATRITLEEIGRSAEYVPIDHETRLAPDGAPIHPLGMVPVLHTDAGRVLSENAAILQFVAAGTPLVPDEAWQRALLQRWLSFIGTELHKAVFIPLLDRKAPDGAKAYARSHAHARLALVNEQLMQREYLVDAYSVADIYLFTVLNWAQATPLRLSDYAGLAAFFERVKARPAVARVLAAETAAFIEERGPIRSAPPTTRAVLDRFNAVFQTHDAGALAELVDEECVIDNTDGARHTGKRACVGLWTALATDPDLAFELEDVETTDERGIILWTLLSKGAAVARGVNVMQVRAGRIVHARGYTRRA